MNNESPTAWESCESDFLADKSTSKHVAKRRRATVRRFSAASAAVALLAVGAWGVSEWASRPAENYFGGIACSEVRELIPAMMAGDLAPNVARQVEVHLESCPLCQRLLEKMQAMAPPTDSVGETTPAVRHELLVASWLQARRSYVFADAR